MNDRLTKVGPGTPCGELMRRYWIPIAPLAQLLENPVRKVRILGEDLVALPRSCGRARFDRRALPAPPRRSAVRHSRRVRAALPLSRLALRRDGHVPRTAARSASHARAAAEAQGLSGARARRHGVRLHGPAAGAGAAALGSLRVAERAAADRGQRARLQLAAVSGEHRRSAAQRLDARPAIRVRRSSGPISSNAPQSDRPHDPLAAQDGRRRSRTSMRSRTTTASARASSIRRSWAPTPIASASTRR